MAIELKMQRNDTRSTVQVTGEVDLYTSPALRKEVLAAVRKSPETAIDLSGVAYMDSSGVATLVEGLQASASAGNRFVLQAPSSAVMKVLQLSRLDSVFEIEA
jgi:anti-sigma B factor antagonist